MDLSSWVTRTCCLWFWRLLGHQYSGFFPLLDLCIYFWYGCIQLLPLVFSWLLISKGEHRSLDIEFNKLGSISLLTSPGSHSFTVWGITASLCQGDQYSSLPRCSTELLRGSGGRAGPKRPVSLTRGYKNLGVDWLFWKSLQKLRKFIGHFEKTSVFF